MSVDSRKPPDANVGRPVKKPLEPGKGPIAFGCGTVLTFVAVFPFALEYLGLGWGVGIGLIAAALVGGLIASRVGDPFFEEAPSWFSWLRWW